jgi:protein TonB
MLKLRIQSLLGGALAIVLSLGLALAQDRDKPIRLGGNVAQANIISKVTPVYPPEAKQNRIQGAVELEVTIDKEGHVTSLSLVSGPPELVESAVEAVRQWVYRPTLLNGEPVSVLTTVTVNYTLAQ